MSPDDDALTTDQYARIAAENAQRRLAYLYQASTTLFAGPLVVGERLLTLARILVPDLGDWCFIELEQESGGSTKIAHHWDANRLESSPGGPASENVRGRVVVPLRSVDTVIGSVTLMFAESNRYYSVEDEALIHELVVRGGWALDAAKQYERATKATADREDILAIVAHDLRNPLATVLMGSTLFMSDPGLDEKHRRTAERISRATGRMEKLVQDLLDWSAIESGRLKCEPETIRVRDILDDVVELFPPGSRDPDVQVDAANTDHTLVRCDRARTNQVFSNLIGNALKFASPGTVVRVSTTIASDMVRFAVADRGPGIAAEHLPHIFERYWQVGGGTKHRRGVGLGLAITRGLVEIQSGRIEVRSELGKGTTFELTLPRAISPA